MITRQGWLVVIGGALLLGAGRLFGVLELFVAGSAALALVVFAMAYVSLTRLRLGVARTVTPTRVYAGTPSRVELTIRNDGHRPSPVLRLVEPVSGTRGADLLLSPLDPDAAARAAYRLPTERRGIVRIGPLSVVVTDPFNLASSSSPGAPRTELTVYPRVDDIVPVPHTHGDDPLAGAEHPSALGRSGEDFYALRQYVQGDDLRRVHWPSTARRDELMVRQDELPWQGRVTVVLDDRRDHHSPASFELVVSAAASVLLASWPRRDLVRLVTTSGFDTGVAAGSAHAEHVMEKLAVLPLSTDGSLRGTLDALAIGAGSGALVVILAEVDQNELAALDHIAGRFGALTVVHFDRSSWDAAAPVATHAPTGRSGRRTTRLEVTRTVPFADAWNRAMHPRAGVVLGAGR